MWQKVHRTFQCSHLRILGIIRKLRNSDPRRPNPSRRRRTETSRQCRITVAKQSYSAKRLRATCLYKSTNKSLAADIYLKANWIVCKAGILMFVGIRSEKQATIRENSPFCKRVSDWSSATQCFCLATFLKVPLASQDLQLNRRQESTNS